MTESTDPTEPTTRSGREWLQDFAVALGCDPLDDATIDTLLALAGEAAHASERIAAPIACYLAGREGVDPGEALALARKV